MLCNERRDDHKVYFYIIAHFDAKRPLHALKPVSSPVMIPLLESRDSEQPFPPVRQALDEPNGLLAIGGCLSPARLETAYRSGIFPWFNEGEPILWWSPDPRLVLRPEDVRISRSLRKRLSRDEFRFTFDTAFDLVMNACAEPRQGASGTWITEDMVRAYSVLHARGLAHSFEAWSGGHLVGGLYGVAIGRVFFGESMFHRMTDASKVAFVLACERLEAWGYRLVDCQVHSRHLESLGAQQISRDEFTRQLSRYCDEEVVPEAWVVPDGPETA